MKPIKTFGLAILAALMAMAFVGVSSATAEGFTALCKKDENPCAANNRITHVHKETKSLALILSSFSRAECAVSFLGDTLNNGLSNPLIIHGTFTYTCENGCTVTEENSPAELKLLQLGSELGDLTLEWLIHVQCVENCRYNGVGMILHSKGPLALTEESGEFAVTEATMNKESGFLCSSKSFLDIGLYTLEPMYIKE